MKISTRVNTEDTAHLGLHTTGQKRNELRGNPFILTGSTWCRVRQLLCTNDRHTLHFWERENDLHGIRGR